MADQTIREKIEHNVVLWLLGTLVTGFVAGIGAYQAVREMAGLATITKAHVERKDDKIDELQRALEKSLVTEAEMSRKDDQIEELQRSLDHAQRELRAESSAAPKAQLEAARAEINALHKQESTLARRLKQANASADSLKQELETERGRRASLETAAPDNRQDPPVSSPAPLASVKGLRIKILFNGARADDALSQRKTLEAAGATVAMLQSSSSAYAGRIYYEGDTLEAALAVKNAFAKQGLKSVSPSSSAVSFHGAEIFYFLQ